MTRSHPSAARWVLDPVLLGVPAPTLDDWAPPAAVQAMGDAGLATREWTAVFCSTKCPGDLILKAYDLARRWREDAVPVIGGFHTPVERDVLGLLLRGSGPVCVVLARGLPKRVPTELRSPLEQGRLLLLSPFGDETRRGTRTTADRRNLVVAALAARVLVVHAAPGSRTEALCRQVVAWGKPLLCLASPANAHLLALGTQVQDFLRG